MVVSKPHPQSSNLEEWIEFAASHYGIEPEFWDIWGRRHVPDGEVRRMILASLGLPVDSAASLRAELERREREAWMRPLPQTLVLAKDGNPVRLPVRHPVPVRNVRVHFRLEDEDGASRSLELALNGEERASATIDGACWVETVIDLPVELPIGYYTLQLDAGPLPACACRLILAPKRAWLPERLASGGCLAGVAVSLYGVRSSRNWGCGDFTDLEQLLDWLKEDVRGSFLALNPLHAIENRQPYNISPYLPASIFFRNPLYLDLERIAEFQQSRAAQRLFAEPRVQQKIAALRQAPLVEYERVWRLKLLFLLILFREFVLRASKQRRDCFERYLQQAGARLDRYALYSALSRRMHRRDPTVWVWPQWPEPYRNPDSPEVARFAQEHAREVLFFKYVQWQVDEQLGAVQSRARALGLPIGLYHDLALAADRCGGDLWTYSRYYVSGCRVGSPPDGFAPEGQDWAFPPPNKEVLREEGYQFFIDAIRANSRHGGALRIDHVMRLFRLYWIPDGVDATRGAYVRDYHQDLLRILALESVRNRFVVVGEDLGTVPDYIRQELERTGVLSYKVFYFEKDAGGRYRHPQEYARQALVATTTHDLPTLAGFWTGRDIEARRAAGLLESEGSYERQWEERHADKQRILDLMHDLGLLPEGFPRLAHQIPELTGEMHNAIIGILVQTPCMLMALNQEDLTKETEQQNLPSSTWQYPNWRRKMRFSVEELRTLPLARDFVAMFRNWLIKTGRAL